MIRRAAHASHADWLADRRNSIGASDVPALFDAHPFITRDELIADKRGGEPKQYDTATRRRFDAGHMLELPLAALLSQWEFAEQIAIQHRPIIPGALTIYRNDAFPRLHASLDFWLTEGVAIIECKAVGPEGLRDWGVYHGADSDPLGTSGLRPKWWKWNPEPPLRVILQAQAQMAVTGAVVVHVAAIAGSEWRTWRVNRAPDLVDMIRAEVIEASKEIGWNA